MAGRMDLRLHGVPQLDRALRRLGRQAPKALAAGLVTEAENVMRESRRQVPVDTGTLRASGDVFPPQVRGSDVEVTMGYTASYAIFVHENLTAHHPVGSAKFLERPLLAAWNGMGRRLASRLERDWRQRL